VRSYLRVKATCAGCIPFSCAAHDDAYIDFCSQQAGQQALAAWEAERTGLRAACENALSELMRDRSSHAEAQKASASALEVCWMTVQ